MSALYATTCIIGIICMAVFMFIGIWLFIVALKAFNQLKYKNYILEKINQNLSVLSNKESFSMRILMRLITKMKMLISLLLKI